MCFPFLRGLEDFGELAASRFVVSRAFEKTCKKTSLAFAYVQALLGSFVVYKRKLNTPDVLKSTEHFPSRKGSPSSDKNTVLAQAFFMLLCHCCLSTGVQCHVDRHIFQPKSRPRAKSSRQLILSGHSLSPTQHRQFYATQRLLQGLGLFWSNTVCCWTFYDLARPVESFTLGTRETQIVKWRERQEGSAESGCQPAATMAISVTVSAVLPALGSTFQLKNVISLLVICLSESKFIFSFWSDRMDLWNKSSIKSWI